MPEPHSRPEHPHFPASPTAVPTSSAAGNLRTRFRPSRISWNAHESLVGGGHAPQCLGAQERPLHEHLPSCTDQMLTGAAQGYLMAETLLARWAMSCSVLPARPKAVCSCSIWLWVARIRAARSRSPGPKPIPSLAVALRRLPRRWAWAWSSAWWVWKQGWQAGQPGKPSQRPRSHWSHRGPVTPGRHRQRPEALSQPGPSVALKSQSQAGQEKGQGQSGPHQSIPHALPQGCQEAVK